MNKAGRRTVQGARDALALAKGVADPVYYIIHISPTPGEQEIRHDGPPRKDEERR
jgi:hypothetical protein